MLCLYSEFIYEQTGFLSHLDDQFWKVRDGLRERKGLNLFLGFVEKVTAVSVRAVAFVEVAKTGFGLIGSVDHCVTSQLLRSMGELATISVRT